MHSVWCFFFFLFFVAVAARCPTNHAMLYTVAPSPMDDMWKVHMVIADRAAGGTEEKTHVIEHWETRVFDRKSCTLNRTVYLSTDDGNGAYIYTRLYKFLKDRKIEMYQHDINRPLVMTRSSCNGQSTDSRNIKFECYPNTTHDIQIVQENTYFVETVREADHEFVVMFNVMSPTAQPVDVIDARRAFESGRIKSYITDPFVLFVYYGHK